MAVNGPDRAPAEIIGHRQYGMKNIGSGDFQAGERGYYYVEDSRIQHRNVRRRFETLRAIFDFARYQRDCLQWAKGAAVQIEADLTNANLIGGTERLALNVGEAALFAKTLAEFIRSLDGIMSTSSSASKWQRRLYSLFAGPLDLPEAHKKYEKHAAALSNEVRSLRGRGTVADASEAAKREVDIFISYSRNDIVRVTPLKKILDELGLEVFLDIDGGIDAGDAWAEVIGDAVFRAKVVLGCWTPHALSRTWVRDECSMAVNSKKLVPVAIEPISKADLRVFEVRDYVDLTDFSGHGIHLGWARTLAAIANMLDAWCAQNPDHSHSAQTTARASVVRKAAELARKGH
jgi:hypothetical protein